jgi:hypothetical protein
MNEAPGDRVRPRRAQYVRSAVFRGISEADVRGTG